MSYFENLDVRYPYFVAIREDYMKALCELSDPKAINVLIKVFEQSEEALRIREAVHHFLGNDRKRKNRPLTVTA